LYVFSIGFELYFLYNTDSEIKSTCAATRTTMNVSIMRMGIFTHLLRLPREGREAGDNNKIYYGSAAFTVNA